MTDFYANPDRGCKDVDPDLFFSESIAELNKAKKICLACPVREPCDAYATREDVGFGVWAGINRSPDAAGRRRRREEKQAEQAAHLTEVRAAVEARRVALDVAVRERWEAGHADGAIALSLDLHPSTVTAIRRRLGLPSLYGPGGRRMEDAR